MNSSVPFTIGERFTYVQNVSEVTTIARNVRIGQAGAVAQWEVIN
jgi:hypothetical protein